MAHAYNISEDGLKLIKAYEGFRPVETVLVSGQKVIGYGHPYVLGEASLLTQQKAEDILKADLEPIEKAINHIVHAPLSQGQFDALASLVFNIGIDAFSESNILHYLNNGQPLAAAAGFDEWRKSIIADKTYIIDALVRRRTAEKALFLTPVTGIVAAPRYELPAMHDDTVESGADDMEVFTNSDVDGFVDQAPYEEAPVQEHATSDASSAALMLSERVAAPQIYEDVVEDIVEDVAIDNVVEIKPEVEIEEEVDIEIEIEAETNVEAEQDEAEIGQDEGLSPIAIAAADVSERLDNLMEETDAEAEVVLSEVEVDVFESASLDAVNDDETPEEIITDFAQETFSEPEIEMLEPVVPEPEIKPEQPAPKVARKKKTKGAGAFWTAFIVGILLIGGSLWKMKFSPTTNIGEMGAFLAPVVLLVGVMMIMGGMLYMIKAQLREPTG